MKPRLKLHLDGTVSLVPCRKPYHYKPSNTRAEVITRIRSDAGSLQVYGCRFSIPHGLLGIALAERYNKGHAMGGRCGALRIMLGIQTHSSPQTKPLDPDLQISLHALNIAWGGQA